MLRPPTPRQPISNTPGIRPGVDNSQNYQNVSKEFMLMKCEKIVFIWYLWLLNLIDSIDCWNDTPRYFTTNQEPVATASHHPFISAISSLHKSVITGMCVLISFWCLHDRKNPYIGPLKVYNYNLFQSPSTMTQASQGITQLSSHIGSSVNSLLNSSTPQLTSQVPSLMSPAMANTSQPFDVGVILNYLYLSKNCLCYYFSYVRHVKRV